MTLFRKFLGPNWNAVRGGGIWVSDGSTAIVKCSKCGLAQNLAGFSIAHDGVVTPDLECSGAECSFAGPIRLEDWSS